MVVISPNSRHLENIRKRAELVLSPVHFERTSFLEPENFHLFLEKIAGSRSDRSAAPTKLMGYSVVSETAETSPSEATSKRSVIMDVLSRLVRKQSKKQNEE